MELLISEITDLYVRENFKRLAKYTREQAPLEGFVHVTIALDRAVSNHKVLHALGYIPLDVVKTHETGEGRLTFNYSLFDKDFIDVSSDGPCRVRALVGTSALAKKEVTP